MMKFCNVNWYLNDDWSGISVWGIVPDSEKMCDSEAEPGG